MTMRERMKNGKLFTDHCEGLPEERLLGKQRMTALNNSDPADVQTRMQLTKELFGEDAKVWVEPPFYCVYGRNIHVNGFAYINVNCSFIDDGDIFIGNGTMFGPGVAIATVGHPIKPDMRKYMYTDPVSIGKNCWIGANVTICPGVTIGDHTVIGAGSVVTKDIPSDVVAVGNPCRVLRPIDERDEECYYKDRKFSDSGIEEDE